MKKVFSLILAAALVAVALCSCAGSASNTDTGNTGPAETTANDKLPSYAGQKVPDYDANGNFILTSSDNREVYPYGTGYAVFTYAGEAVTKIQQVLVFEDEAVAEKYVNDIAIEAINKGEVPPTLRANGNYVIVAVGASNDSKELGYYYTQSKTKVTSDFATEVEQ